MAEIVDFGLQQHKIKMDSRYFENVLSVVAGDTGRRLEVQLLDTNGMVQDTTGLNLRLNAEIAGKATFTDAALVDATTGKYQLDLSNGMFLAPGNWQFQWQIIDVTGKKLHSFAFTGNVGNNISEGGSQATNFYLNLEDLKAMQDDLVNGTIDSSILETNITEKLTDLETQYAPKLTEVTAQLAQKATKDELQQISLSYKESYATLSLLQSAYPTGSEYNHAVLSDGMIYTYKNGWISTQIQANGTGVPDGSITKNKIESFNISVSKNKFNKLGKLNERPASGTYGTTIYDEVNDLIVTTGLEGQKFGTGQKIAVKRNTSYTISLRAVGQNGGYSIHTEANTSLSNSYLALANGTVISKTFNSGSNDFVYFLPITNSVTGTYGLTEVQLEEGTVKNPYESYKASLVSIFNTEIADLESRNNISELNQRVDSISGNGKYHIDKNTVLMGDSITADPTWWTKNMLERLSFKSYLNLARSGATWTHTSETVYDIVSTSGAKTPDNVIWNQVNKLIDRVSKSLTPIPEVVVILAGSNDIDRTVGNASTAFVGASPVTPNAPNTILDVASAVRYSCETLLNIFPNVQIILATPLQRGLDSNAKIFEIGQIVKDCAGNLGAEVIEQGKESGIYGKYDVGTNHKYLYDNLHPNTAGNEKIGAFVANELKLKIVV